MIPTIAAGLALLCATTALAQLRVDISSPDRVTWNGRHFGQAEQISYLRWSGVELGVSKANGGSGTPVSDVVASRLALRGVCARVDLGLAPGSYLVSVELAGDGTSAARSNGTIEVALQGRSAMLIEPSHDGGPRRASATVEVARAPLQIFFKPEVGSDVAIRAIEVRAANGDTLGAPVLLPERRVPLRDGDDADSVFAPDARLRELIDYLRRYQLSSGLFDYTSAAWWEAGLSLHALLLSAELTGDARALELTRPGLDLLVARQEEDGGFCAYAYSSARGASPDSVGPCDTRNVADLGVATACLSLAAPLVDAARRERFVAAHRRYIDEFAARYRLPSGAFANGLFAGRRDSTAYSVATATTAMSLVALYSRTGEPRYLSWAEDAARFLARAWAMDGRPLFHPHRPEEPRPLELEEWNDLYYLLEGLLWVREVTRDDALRTLIDGALHACVYGEKGLLASHPEAELPILRRERRAQAKVNGMTAVILSLRRVLGPEPRLDALAANSRTSLLDSARALDREVFARPYDQTGIEAIVATSFAGLAYAEMVSPGSAFRTIKE